MTNQKREGSFKFYTSMVAALLGELLDAARNRKKKDEMHERPTDTWDGQ